MKKSNLLFILAAVLMIMPTQAFATYVFSPAISYAERNIDNNGTPSDAKVTTLDFRFGYTLDFGLYFGGMYSLHDEEIFVDSSDAYAGLSVGFDKYNLFVVGTVFLYAEKDLSAGGIKYAKGSGFQIDVSYLAPIAEDIYLGPQLSYFEVDFKDQQVNGSSTSANFKIDGITPGFNVTFKFK